MECGTYFVLEKPIGLKESIRIAEVLVAINEKYSADLRLHVQRKEIQLEK